MSTRLKLGVTLTNSELILVVKSLSEKLEELEKKYDELSKDRRGTSSSSGETLSTTPLYGKPKL